MDITKLEKLACLKLDDSIKEELSKSLDEVVNNLQEVTKIDISNLNLQPQKVENTVFREEKFQKPLTSGLNKTDEGFFLAPKVIRKE